MRLETYIRKSLKLKSHFIVQIEEEEKYLIARVERIEGRHLSCGVCGLKTSHTCGRLKERRWRDLTIRDKPLLLVYIPYRVKCPVCGVRVEKVPWAPRWSRVTDALARSIALLARRMSWKEVAEYFDLDWKVVAAIVRRAVSEGLRNRKWKPLHQIGVDEVSRKKGHQYLTLVYDLERKSLIWVGKDRKEETMNKFFQWLGKRKARSIKAVCCDMWAPYLKSIREHLPQATIVFDRFHIVQHLNRALDEVRREEVKKLQGEERVDMKKTRYILLKNPWNLKPKEKRRLSYLIKLNNRIIRGYFLKESFQKFWGYISRGWAEKHLKHWLWWASHSRLEPMKEFAKKVRKHLEGILAWTKLRISNGALEGMNNKVKLVSHRAFGFRNADNYIANIFHCCADLPI
jgi:transposase